MDASATFSGPISLTSERVSRPNLGTMPAEILDQILQELLGDQKIHVGYDKSLAKIAKSQSTGLYTHICSNETHKIEKSLEPEGAADDAFYQQPFKTRHLACHASRQAKRDRAILGICRRFYHEGSYILWATNTFIFEDSSALEAFTAFVNRPNNTDIRQNLRKICLSATLSGIKKDQLLKDLDYLVLSDNLNVAKPILSAFKYIKTLEIWADYMPGSRTTAAATSEPRTREEALEEKERPIKEALGVLQPFRRLGLRYARLVLTDDDGDLYRKKGIASERLTWQEKNDLAAECGRELLDRVEESERGGKEDMEVLEQGKEEEMTEQRRFMEESGRMMEDFKRKWAKRA